MTAVKARIVAPINRRTITGSASRRTMSPSGNPAILPSVNRRSNAGAIARQSPGSAVIDSAVETMITSWIA